MKPSSILCFSLLLAGGIGGACYATAELQDRQAPHTAAVSCPLPADIAPCVCTPTSDDLYLDIDCSSVVDEAQLETVFQADFPDSRFRRLTIYQNENLLVLRDGAFGNVSFEEIWITDGVLQEVQDGALFGSANTARSLIFNMNNITTFPFTSILSFNLLQSLDLRINNLRGFPLMISGTLQVLYLSHNPLGDLPSSAFDGTPAIVDLHLSSAEIPHILPGTFTSLTQLRNVGLGNNNIEEVVADAVQCNDNTGLVDLGLNRIRSVEPNAFPGLQGAWLYIHHNHLTTLDEEVWRPLVEHDGYVDPYGNPLLCGCDIAWLLRNATLLEAVDVYTTCADGRLLVNLDPADYDQCP